MTTRFFCSFVRHGAAAAIVESDALAGPFAGPATFAPALTLARDGVPLPTATVGPPLSVIGPEAVTGIAKSLVVRTDPAPGSTNVEDNHLVQVELARVDFPWLFTPAAPNAAGRLRPWLVLIVVESASATIQPGMPLPRITVPNAALPDLADSWAWAHAQVTTDGPVPPAAPPDPFTGPAAISRLLCPRRLSADTDYIACIVPATLPGVKAGLGLPLDAGPQIAPAWQAGSGSDVLLPVYYSWTFSTGDGGDFKSLVERLTGVRPDTIAGFGTRTIDASAPWETPPQAGDGMTIELDGALGIGVDRPGTLAGDALAAFQARLTSLLNFAATLAPAAPDPTLSAVAPPIYAGVAVAATTVPKTPGWLQTLNLDPRRRIAAAFGTRYVQENREFLMARAWDQIGAVQEANRLRALAEMAVEIGDRLHARHIAPLGPSAMIAVAAPARTRTLIAPSITLQAHISATPLPAGASSNVFNRLTRPLGAFARRVYSGARSTVIERGIAGAVTTSSPSASLDGIGNLSAVFVATTADVASQTATLAWSRIGTFEQSYQAPANLETIRQSLTRGSAAAGIGLALSPPMLAESFVPGVSADAGSIATQLAPALRPSAGILRRLDARVLVPGQLGAGVTRRIMAGPTFPAPLALALVQKHPELFLPGLGNFPDEHVTLLRANGAFIESFLAGANDEMNRELLWRDFPTDRRGTPFRCFWPRPDGSPDIPPIPGWSAATPLGQNGASAGAEDMVVLLVRGALLHRFPRTLVVAVPGKIDGLTVTLDVAAPPQQPSFLMRLDATTTMYAYQNLRTADIRSDFANGKAGWYFVFSEPLTGPRFKFDEPAGNAFTAWTELDWATVPTARGFAIAGADIPPPPAPVDPAPVPGWNHDAADIARIAFARPFRIGFHADELLAGVM